MRGLQNAWSMEDINTQIRFSGGRERQQLVKERGRMATVQGMESGQIETQKSRQEQVWAREDEQYKKQVQYSNEMMALDRRQFDLNKDQRETIYSMDKANLARQIGEYKEQFKIQEQMIKAQREYQDKQIAFQKAAAGLQAESAKVQHDLDLATRNANKNFGETEGYLNKIASYDKAVGIMNTLYIMVGKLNDLDVSKINAINSMLEKIKNFRVPDPDTP
jgi:hypothetical protein